MVAYVVCGVWCVVCSVWCVVCVAVCGGVWRCVVVCGGGGGVWWCVVCTVWCVLCVWWRGEGGYGLEDIAPIERYDV